MMSYTRSTCAGHVAGPDDVHAIIDGNDSGEMQRFSALNRRRKTELLFDRLVVVLHLAYVCHLISPFLEILEGRYLMKSDEGCARGYLRTISR